MSNLIQQEQAAAEAYMLETFETREGKKLAALTRENAARVEAMVQTDSDYRKSADKTYPGSTAFCMTRLADVLYKRTAASGEAYAGIIRDAVVAVDRENSTHLNADGVGREQITARIAAFAPDALLDCLKRGSLGLFHEIARPTEHTPRPRANFSFASKFCHYACFYLFEGEPEQDNYPIWDTVLNRSIHLYLEYYGLETGLADRKRDYSGSYETYKAAVDRVIAASGGQISRNGFDHILWYYFKGNM